MFILRGIDQLTNEITKAKKIHLRVEFDRFGRYQVSGSKGEYYTVNCRKDNCGVKAVECTCQGGEKGLVCYHSVAALSLQVGLAGKRNSA